jgi:hypothetical protein
MSKHSGPEIVKNHRHVNCGINPHFVFLFCKEMNHVKCNKCASCLTEFHLVMRDPMGDRQTIDKTQLFMIDGKQ